MLGAVERVHVHVRVRPVGRLEREAASPECLEVCDRGAAVPTALRLSVADRRPGDRGGVAAVEAAREYTFDSVLPPGVSQAAVYERAAQPIVTDVVNGFNGTILAYGQTGTGKTHTMMGPDPDGPERGLVPRAVEQIFETSLMDEKHSYCTSVSYLQVCSAIVALPPTAPKSALPLPLSSDTPAAACRFTASLSKIYWIQSPEPRSPSMKVATSSHCFNRSSS